MSAAISFAFEHIRYTTLTTCKCYLCLSNVKVYLPESLSLSELSVHWNATSLFTAAAQFGERAGS